MKTLGLTPARLLLIALPLVGVVALLGLSLLPQAPGRAPAPHTPLTPFAPSEPSTVGASPAPAMPAAVAATAPSEPARPPVVLDAATRQRVLAIFVEAADADIARVQHSIDTARSDGVPAEQLAALEEKLRHMQKVKQETLARNAG